MITLILVFQYYVTPRVRDQASSKYVYSKALILIFALLEASIQYIAPITLSQCPKTLECDALLPSTQCQYATHLNAINCMNMKEF